MASLPQPLTYTDMVVEYGAAHMAPYLRFTRGGHVRAVRLHRWNALVGAAFHASLASVEIALRRRVDDAFTDAFGQFWWATYGFRSLASRGTLKSIDTARARITGPATHDQVVAELSFGTVVALIRKRFYDRVWRTRYSTAFPNHVALPFRGIATVASRVLDLRNAISHHQPLIGMNLTSLHDDLLELVGWMSQPLRQRVAGASRVPRWVAVRP